MEPNEPRNKCFMEEVVERKEQAEVLVKKGRKAAVGGAVCSV